MKIFFSVPSIWVMHTLNKLVAAWFPKIFDSFGVLVKRMTLFLKIKFWPVDLHWSHWCIQERLCPVHICSSWWSVILHHTSWCKEVVDKIGTIWHCKTNAKNPSCFVVQINSEFHSRVRCKNGFFKVLHILSSRNLSAVNWV